MDINDLRSLLTAAGFLCFLVIVGWAYGKGSKKGFEEAAMLPFAEYDDQAAMARPSQPRRQKESK